ncbi:MAG TPA: RluA family pseudouridine synthase [Candidatus Dormibacteraeota bacterium]|nr:RluA family pseudouridine synthase [Candidatus Dormibacteraeota bacterium]
MSNTRPLLDWLLLKHPETPKTRAKQWILAGRVTLNGVVVRKPHHVTSDPGDTLQLGTRHAGILDCGTGWHIHPRVSLLHLDSSLAIVNKGPGLISVPAEDNDLSALSILADYLDGKLKPRDREAAQKSIPPVYRHLRPLPVHRLDKYTSGVFCMATNPAARHHLIEQLKERTMKREYIAFVEGRSPNPKGTWRQFLQLSRDEMRQNVVTEAQARAAGDQASEAITHYEVIAEYPLAGTQRVITKLRLRLETGRKHQIRAHAANAGLPLIGDRTYNPAFRPSEPATGRIDFPRQALHAEVLTLEHPAQAGQRLSWTAELPKDLWQLETALRSGRIAA